MANVLVTGMSGDGEVDGARRATMRGEPETRGRARFRQLRQTRANLDAPLVAEQVIEREEVVALLFNVSDIVSALERIERLLEEDDGEEEADQG